MGNHDSLNNSDEADGLDKPKVYVLIPVRWIIAGVSAIVRWVRFHAKYIKRTNGPTNL